MLSSNGPENIPGKSVSTSILILKAESGPDFNRALWSLRQTRCKPTLFRFPWILLFDNFDRTPNTLFSSSHKQQRAYRMDSRALSADYLSRISWMHTQFIESHSIAFNRRNAHCVWSINERLGDKLQESLHKARFLIKQPLR
jgi:hypothetical protein